MLSSHASHMTWDDITVHRIVHYTMLVRMYFAGHNNVLEMIIWWNPLYIGHLSCFTISSVKHASAKKKYMCVYCHMSKNSRVGRSGLLFFFYFIDKTGNSRSRFRNPIPVFNFRKFWKNYELCSFSTFFALNFDKKLAVE